MRFRGKSIRRKIVALLLVPLVSLTGLWVFATVVTGREAGELMGASTVVRKVGIPMEEAVRAVQAERRQTLVFLADPRASDALPELRSRRAATDREVADVRASARQKDIRASLGSEAETQLDSVLGEIDGLAALRQSVEKRTIDRPHAMAFYNGLVDPGYRFLNGLRTMDNVTMDRQVRALVGISRARELLSREDALIASGLTAGRLGAPDLRKISDLVAGRDLLYDVNLDLLPGPERRHRACASQCRLRRPQGRGGRVPRAEPRLHDRHRHAADRRIGCCGFPRAGQLPLRAGGIAFGTRLRPARRSDRTALQRGDPGRGL